MTFYLLRILPKVKTRNDHFSVHAKRVVQEAGHGAVGSVNVAFKMFEY